MDARGLLAAWTIQRKRAPSRGFCSIRCSSPGGATWQMSRSEETVVIGSVTAIRRERNARRHSL